MKITSKFRNDNKHYSDAKKDTSPYQLMSTFESEKVPNVRRRGVSCHCGNRGTCSVRCFYTCARDFFLSYFPSGQRLSVLNVKREYRRGVELAQLPISTACEKVNDRKTFGFDCNLLFLIKNLLLLFYMLFFHNGNELINV